MAIIEKNELAKYTGTNQDPESVFINPGETVMVIDTDATGDLAIVRTPRGASVFVRKSLLADIDQPAIVLENPGAYDYVATVDAKNKVVSVSESEQIGAFVPGEYIKPLDGIVNNLKFLHGKSVLEIQTFEYMGKTCIGRIDFTDGFSLVLSGSCDNCNAEYIEDDDGNRIYLDGADE